MSTDPFPPAHTPLIRPGTGPLEAMLQREKQRAQREQQISRIILQADPSSIDTTAASATSRATLPGDTRRLRGIPAIGYGVTGAIPGTIPDAA